jgi:hypothetical protein
MKRPLVAIALAVIVVIGAVGYGVSAFANRSDALRVKLASEKLNPKVVVYRASLVNDGYLPVFVGRCERVNDAMGRDVVVGDEIQRWDVGRGAWNTIAQRTGCDRVPLGVVEARFRRRLLWPTQHLYTAPFVPSTQVVRTGDKVRFVVFADDQKTVQLISAAFVVD